MWIPTLWGWLFVLVVAVGLVLLLARNLHAFLAVTQPVGARVLVVEGTIPTEALDWAIPLFRSGGYQRIVTTGGPVAGYPELAKVANYAEFAASYLRAHGLADVQIDAVPAPQSAQDRTFLCAVMLRDWAAQSGVALDAIDLVSVGAHARRSRALFQAALGPDVRVGIVAAVHPEIDPDAWWNTSAGAKHTIVEALNWAWVALFFHPPPTGSHEERWALPRRNSDAPAGMPAAGGRPLPPRATVARGREAGRPDLLVLHRRSRQVVQHSGAAGQRQGRQHLRHTDAAGVGRALTPLRYARFPGL